MMNEKNTFLKTSQMALPQSWIPQILELQREKTTDTTMSEDSAEFLIPPPLFRQESDVGDVIISGTPTFCRTRSRPILKLKKRKMDEVTTPTRKLVHKPSEPLKAFLNTYDPFPICPTYQKEDEEITPLCEVEELPPHLEKDEEEEEEEEEQVEEETSTTSTTPTFSNAEQSRLSLEYFNMNDYEFRGSRGLLNAASWYPCSISDLKTGELFRYTRPKFTDKTKRSVNSAIVNLITPTGIFCQAKNNPEKVWEVKLTTAFSKYIRIYAHK